MFDGTQVDMDRESDPTIEITVLNGFRLIEYGTFLDVEEGQDRQERERPSVPVALPPIVPLVPLVPLVPFAPLERHEVRPVDSTHAALAEPETSAVPYRDACRRVLAPFPVVRSSFAIQRIREMLCALAFAAWRGPGVAVVRTTSSAVLTVLLWLGAVRRRLAVASSSRDSFPGLRLHARLARITRHAGRFMLRGRA
jgi:hypothetical protein